MDSAAAAEICQAMKLLLAFILACAAALAESWDGVQRVVAVGDVHGGYSQFTTLLRQAGLLEPSKDKWAGGKTHLVQLGDIPDRGPDTRRILDLLMELEKQAKKAGGMVHPLIGNHEAMNIYGDLRYATPEEFASFRRSNSQEIQAEFWRAHAADLQAKGEAAKLTPQYRAEWEKQFPPGFAEHRYEFGPNGKYGNWIRKHNAVIRINDTLFLHGGISPKYAQIPIKEINQQIRRELEDFKRLDGGIVPDPDGPLWYRGLALAAENDLEQHLNSVLQFHGVKRIVIGHTRTMGAILSRFNGKVILADVGLSTVYGSRLACLVIEGEKLTAIHRGNALPLPASAAETLAYLKKAAAYDPAPSPLLAAIKAMESSELVAAPLATSDDETSARRR
jgi:hypothetical protein